MQSRRIVVRKKLREAGAQSNIGACETDGVGDLTPREFHDEADQSVEVEECNERETALKAMFWKPVEQQGTATEVCASGSVGEDPEEFHDEADAKVGVEEKDGIEERRDPIQPVVERLQEQLELGAIHEECPSRSFDEQETCGLYVDSDLLEVVRGGELLQIVPRGCQSRCGRRWRTNTEQTRRKKSSKSRASMGCG